MLDAILDRWIRSEAGKGYLNSKIRNGLQMAAVFLFTRYLKQRGVDESILTSWNGVVEGVTPALVVIALEIWTVVRVRARARQTEVAIALPQTKRDGTPVTVTDVKEVDRQMQADKRLGVDPAPPQALV